MFIAETEDGLNASIRVAVRKDAARTILRMFGRSDFRLAELEEVLREYEQSMAPWRYFQAEDTPWGLV